MTFFFSEYKVPDVTYPDFDNFEVKNETDEWQKLFYFTLEECKLQDSQETVKIIWFQTQNTNRTVIFSVQNFNMIVMNS